MDVMKLAKSMLKNQYVLYAVMAVSALQLMGYFSINDPECLVLFVLSALASRAFSTNLVINLGVALAASNVLFAGKCARRVVESFQEGAHCNSETEEFVEGTDGAQVTEDAEEECPPGFSRIEGEKGCFENA